MQTLAAAAALAPIIAAALAGPAAARAAGREAARTSAVPPTRTFHSESYVHPPVVWMSGKDPDPAASGDIFVDSQNSIQAGPMILNPYGQLIWFKPLHRAAAFNVQVQRYEGQSVLTYWQGYVTDGYGIGADVILNHQYHTVATVRAADGLYADLHEFQLTPSGDALITAYKPIHNVNLSAVGGSKRGTLLDCVIQEIDVATGRLVWQWDAYQHVHVGESYAGKPNGTPYDFFHLNSIQQLPNGNLLVSARATWALYEINPKTDRIALVIGGKRSSFKMGRGAQFEWQHDAHMNADGTITVFDDGDGPFGQSESQSRALRIRLNDKTRRATLVHAYTNSPSLLSSSQGSVQVLPDGNTFVGWGSSPYFTEFSRSGRQLFSLHFGQPMQSYRAYRFQWWGQPTTPPSIAATGTAHGTRIYASWNGATDVASWQVLAGSSATSLAPVARFHKSSFETKSWLANTEPYFAVEALSGDGQVLATSAAVRR